MLAACRAPGVAPGPRGCPARAPAFASPAPRAPGHRPSLRPCARRRASLRVAAAATGPPPKKGSGMLQGVLRECDSFLQRYDVVSCGMGALVVTSWCVYNGQDAATALSITFVSTVAALVINELWSQEDSWL